MTLALVRFSVPFMLRLVTPRPPSVGGLKLGGGGMANGHAGADRCYREIAGEKGAPDLRG